MLVSKFTHAYVRTEPQKTRAGPRNSDPSESLHLVALYRITSAMAGVDTDVRSPTGKKRARRAAASSNRVAKRLASKFPRSDYKT